jgi:hypothetical protein
MALTDNDFRALRVLFQEEIEPFRQEINQRFDGVLEQLDGLYQGNEKREQEYLVINNQLARLEDRVDVIEKKSP